MLRIEVMKCIWNLPLQWAIFEANDADTDSLLLENQRLTTIPPVVFITAPTDISRPSGCCSADFKFDVC